jgi:hypothetical protein
MATFDVKYMNEGPIVTYRPHETVIDNPTFYISRFALLILLLWFAFSFCALLFCARLI